MKPVKWGLLFVTIVVFALGGAPTTRAAMVIEWGTPLLNEPLYDSYGAPMTDAFTWQLGVFWDSALGVEFDPTTSSEPWTWADKWVVFDQAVFDTSSPFSPVVYGEATILDDGTSSSTYAPSGFDFSGLKAYVWAFNTQVFDYGLEWLIYRSSDWAFPVDPVNPPVPEDEWLNVDLLEDDVPVWGNQNGIIDIDVGDYSYASNPVPGDISYENGLLQSYTILIPEPGTYAVGALLVAIGGFQWWSRRRGKTLEAV